MAVSKLSSMAQRLPSTATSVSTEVPAGHQVAVVARSVVVATGPFQKPLMPRLLPETSNILQLHAAAYKAPKNLPGRAVLVVGTGASGAQIADELMRAGRQVYLSVNRHRRTPRRYRGHDHVWWWRETGLDRTPVDQRPSVSLPVIHTGAYSGYKLIFVTSRGRAWCC
jgi:putative flavoprotein involved in K+ transport